MANNSMAAKGILSQLYSSFPVINQTAISHIPAENGDDLYLIVVHAQPQDGTSGGKQNPGGADNGFKRVKPHPHADQGVNGVSNGRDEEQPQSLASTADQTMNRRLIKLLQQPVTWAICNSKQNCGGADPGYKKRKHYQEAEVPQDLANPAAAAVVGGNAESGGADPGSPADAALGVLQLLDELTM
jgi:hypothetical protein